MEEKDRAFEIQLNGPNDVSGKVRFENINNRVFAKMGDIFIDRLSWFRWNNAVKFFDKYEKIKEKRNMVGKETPLPPKYLIEILGNGFIEDDETLQEIWIRLLANWQDPNKKMDKRPLYLDIIKSLTLTEVKILDTVSKLPNISSYMVGSEQGIDSEKLMSLLEISKEDYQLSILNLFRCGCFESLKIENKGISMGGIYPVKDFGTSAISLTILGFNLINNIRE